MSLKARGRTLLTYFYLYEFELRLISALKLDIRADMKTGV